MFTLILVRRSGARQVWSPRAATSDQPVPRAFRILLNSPSLRGRCTPTIPPHLAPLSSEDGVLNFHPAPLLNWTVLFPDDAEVTTSRIPAQKRLQRFEQRLAVRVFRKHFINEKRKISYKRKNISRECYDVQEWVPKIARPRSRVPTACWPQAFEFVSARVPAFPPASTYLHHCSPLLPARPVYWSARRASSLPSLRAGLSFGHPPGFPALARALAHAATSLSARASVHPRVRARICASARPPARPLADCPPASLLARSLLPSSYSPSVYQLAPSALGSLMEIRTRRK